MPTSATTTKSSTREKPRELLVFLISDKIKENLWIQINWLYENREYHLGGNHLLENLITLISKI